MATTIGYREIVKSNTEARQGAETEFRLTFGRPIHQYAHPLVGFDVVKFDKFVAPNDGESTYEAIQRKYGPKAVKLIKGILSTELGG